METQQFHLKWNNHSLNTLSSFQHLLDTNTLVDVSLTCSNGKTVTAHRMVLAACSDYFYRLFKDLPEKHPVIVFKDAGEEIVRDLLLFMYRGEVEVQEAYLNDFLKFADTLQVKGLSQSDRDEQAKLNNNNNNNNNNSSRSPVKDSPLSLVKAGAAAGVGAAGGTPMNQPPMSDLAKSYLAGLSKFPPIFPHMPTEPMNAAAAAAAVAAGGNPADLFGTLASPNLYRALQRKNLDNNPALLKQMPFLKKMFAAEGGDLAFPGAPGAAHGVDPDLDSSQDRSTPPPMPQHPLSMPPMTPVGGSGSGDENGLERPLASDSPYPPSSSGPGSAAGDLASSPKKNNGGNNDKMDADKTSGRGSRLEKMIAAEYKIMNEYTDHPSDMLPVMTPELMKSRRTHSLQLAIAEIMHNRASVQSAATKYHIPRETLRRHYQRYLKAMGIQKKAGETPGTRGGPTPNSSSSGTTTPTLTSGGGGAATPPVRNNNNSKQTIDQLAAAAAASAGATPVTSSAAAAGSMAAGMAAAVAAAAAAAAAQSGEDGGSNGFSSLMDIGAAYGIWNPDVDAADFKKKNKGNKESNEKSEESKEKLVIDEDEEEEEEEEPLSPGGPESEPMDSAPTSTSKTAASAMETSA